MKDNRKYRFTKEQLKDAYSYDLITYLHQRGYALKKQGNRVVLADHDSLVISGNLWCWHSRVGPDGKKLGGNVVQFAELYENMERDHAIAEVLRYAGKPVPDPQYITTLKKKTRKRWYIPRASPTTDELTRYLVEERKISPLIVRDLLAWGYLYESEKYGNVVFVGRDEKGIIRNIFMRATDDSGLKLAVPRSHEAYNFRLMADPATGSETLYVFEAAIDLLSHATMFQLCGRDWTRDSRVSLGGVGPASLDKALELSPHIREVVLCLDRDEPGRRAAAALKKRCEDKGYTVRILEPVRKDLNKDLTDGESWIRRRERFLERLSRAMQPAR